MAETHDQVFKALADASRRRILAALCHEPAFAGELGRLVGLAPNAVSFHLKELRAAGLVTSHRRGRHLQYRPNLPVLGSFVQQVQTMFPGDSDGDHAEPPPRTVRQTSSGVSRPQRSPLPPAVPPPSAAEAPDAMPTELL